MAVPARRGDRIGGIGHRTGAPLFGVAGNLALSSNGVPHIASGRITSRPPRWPVVDIATSRLRRDSSVAMRVATTTVLAPPRLSREDARMQTPTPSQHALLSRLADSLVGARSLEDLVRPLLEMLETVTGLESTYMTTIDEAAGLQHILYSRNTRRLEIPEGLAVPWDDTLCKRALEEGCPYTDDVAGQWGDSDAARALGIATYASTPIRGPAGALYGTLCAASDERKPLRADADRVLQMFSLLIGQQMEREQLMQDLHTANDRLRHNAMTDAVTGLPNRRALMDELARRLARRARDGSHVLIAFIDLDGFKQINDHHGHEAGDRFLAAIAGALSRCHRADDFTARLGGDEFVVLGSEHADDRVAENALRDHLQAATTGRFDLGDCTIDYAGPSIGVITARPDQHDAAAELARADVAMYAVKRVRKANPGSRSPS